MGEPDAAFGAGYGGMTKPASEKNRPACGFLRREERYRRWDMFGRKKKDTGRVAYDPGAVYPALRCSICTGEQVGGLKRLDGGGFEELMLIRNDADLAAFRRRLGLSADEEIEKFY